MKREITRSDIKVGNEIGFTLYENSPFEKQVIMTIVEISDGLVAVKPCRKDIDPILDPIIYKEDDILNVFNEVIYDSDISNEQVYTHRTFINRNLESMKISAILTTMLIGGFGLVVYSLCELIKLF
jgi:hypothetical protein